jgi:hypothetical protein
MPLPAFRAGQGFDPEAINTIQYKKTAYSKGHTLDAPPANSSAAEKIK